MNDFSPPPVLMPVDLPDRIAGVTNYFFSINQETRVPVGTPLDGGFLPSMVRETYSLRRLERMPSWCRSGYREELFVSAEPQPT